jgi:hypothetical protein
MKNQVKHPKLKSLNQKKGAQMHGSLPSWVILVSIFIGRGSLDEVRYPWRLAEIMIRWVICRAIAIKQTGLDGMPDMGAREQPWTLQEIILEFSGEVEGGRAEEETTALRHDPPHPCSAG